MKSQEGLWNEVIDPATGESSIKVLNIKVVSKLCSQQDHNFEPISNSSRKLKCTRCGMESHYVLGLQKLENGKVINIPINQGF